MHISKITNPINTQSFKGYKQEINNVGEPVYRFNIPHSSDADAKIQFYAMKKENDGSTVYTPVSEQIALKDEGTIVNLKALKGVKLNMPVAYSIYVDGKHVIDSGLQNSDGMNIIPQVGTSPRNQGQSILTIPDSHRAGAYYAGFDSPETGKVIYDKAKQKAAEGIIPNSANEIGGTLAGLEYDVKNFKDMGVKTIFSTPIWGADNKNASRYWTKNLMQISEEVGNSENYETFVRTLFANGRQYVDDFAVTSEGLEGVHVQYALRWANQNPQTYYWFRMSSTKDNPIVFGVANPDNPNLRFTVINPTVKYNAETKKIEANPDYDSNKETYFQVYDVSQVSKEQIDSIKEPISKYDKALSENEIAINSSKDTVINYAFEIKPQEYEQRLKSLVEYNKTAKTPIDIDSPQGALFVGQFSNFKIGQYSEGASFWDGNNDMLKFNHHISGYDEKLLEAIPDLAQRDYERKMIERANCEVQDMAIQAGKYRSEVIKDAQILYAAQVLKDAKTESEISKLISDGLLPEDAKLNSDSINNVLSGWYELAPKGGLTKDDVTIKALMELPLDSLELGDNTVGVLSTSFFSNRATDVETIGQTRFEMYKQGAEVLKPYSSVYNKINTMYETVLREFADEVINKVNEASSEKLLDANGNYTEYGEYVLDLMGKDIAKYAYLKAIAGDKLQTKYMPQDVLDGKITYNYSQLKKDTTLKALGINASTPQEEANMLANRIQKGMDKLDAKDVEYVSNSILKRIAGTNTNSFRLAEAMTNKAGLGINIRLDAAKDVIDMDAVRNGDMSFDEAWDQLISFWKKFVQEIKEVNPSAYIVAEVTDVNMLMEDIYGAGNVYDNVSSAGGKYKNYNEALSAFFNETGITTEAGYAYTFTDLLKLFSSEFETGYVEKDLDKRVEGFKERISDLIKTRGLDYVRNLWTFADNHDKPSIIHCAAMNMGLFYANLDMDINSMDFEKNRKNRILALRELTNSDNFEDIPLEAVMNMDNRDYFRTVSTRAVAMNNLMRDCINDTISDEEVKKALKNALADLTSGNYLGTGTTYNAQTLNIPELSSLEKSLSAILYRAEINLSQEVFDNIIKNAKQFDKIKEYTVRGDFDWAGKVGERNKDLANSIIGSTDDYMKYDLYSIGITALLLDSYKEVMADKADIAKFKNGGKKFVDEFDRAKLNQERAKLPALESTYDAMKKNGYAARDFETVINMIIKQAEFNSGKAFSQAQRDEIMLNLFRASTEPAIQKALMYGSFLSALPGVPSMFMRDLLGGLGYEEKAKNVYMQNRSAVKWSELEEGPLKEYRQQIFDMMKDVISIRSKAGMNAINEGTPYMLETSDKNVMAFLYQDPNGDMAVSIMNATGIKPKHRAKYNSSRDKNAYSINNTNKHVPVQPQLNLEEVLLPAGLAIAGAEFINIASSDSVKYVIKNGKLVTESGSPIVLNGKTAKNGVMILKKLKPAFRGRNINKQYNIVSNPYAKAETPEVGENLAVIAR